MRAFMLIGATAIVLSSVVPNAEARWIRSDGRMNLPANAIPRGSWVNPQYETLPFSLVSEGALGPIGYQITPDDALRGTGESYVSLPAPESRDTAVFPKVLINLSTKPEALPSIADAKAWCQSRVTVGTGMGFCVVN